MANAVSALVAAGFANQRAGRLTDAEQCYRAALKIDAGNADASYLMGVLAVQCGNGDNAMAFLSRVVDARRSDAGALYNMGMANVLSGHLGEAERWLQRAIEINPQFAPAQLGLGHLYMLLGRTDLWPKHYRAGALSKQANAAMFSNLLVAMHSDPSASFDELYDLHREWERRFASAAYARWQPHANDRSIDRPLRVGFVSNGFRETIVGHFFRGVLRALAARDDVELCLYSNTTKSDWLSLELKQLAHRWREIASLDDQTVASTISSDRIDILIDLDGHAPGNRLLVFALKPAPVQISWLDYFDTTGLAAMDYVITDPVSTPPNGRQRFVERLLRMPTVRLCFSPPPFAPEVAPLPALHREHVAFGCFTRCDKIGPTVIGVWATVLAAVPDSRLVLKGDLLRFPEVRDRFSASLAARGIGAERVELRTGSTHEQLLYEYGEIDIALDPFPYNGGATTCDAIWMGVPVVALLGDSMISRQTAAILQSVGLDRLVAHSEDAYVGVAIDLAHDLPRLAALRQALRPAIAASPLCDATAFANAFSDHLRLAWREWSERTRSSESA